MRLVRVYFTRISSVTLIHLLLGIANAQQYYGTLTGTVTDTSGAVLPNVDVTATSLQKGIAIKTTTNELGIYRLVNLTPDSYRVEAAAQAAGFKRFVREPVLVETDRILSLDIILEVGANTETVTVSGAPPILDTQTGSTNSTVEGSLVDRLPALGVGPSRNSTKFALMQLPGSSSAANDTTRQTNRVMINGGRSTQLAWDEDGMPNRSATGGGNMHDASINNDSLRAIQYTLVNAGILRRRPVCRWLRRAGRMTFTDPRGSTLTIRSSTRIVTTPPPDRKRP